MTREYAKREIDSLDFYLQNHTDDYGEESHMAMMMAIKSLEQEDNLDKIRAEIEQTADKQFQIAMGVSDLNERYAHIQMENAYRHCLNVIDKYKAESEE